MGRGRAKAKQTKVARELKYHSPTTDYDALQRELSGGDDSVEESVDEPTDGYGGSRYDLGRHDDDRFADRYADRYGADDPDQDSADERWASSR